MIKPAWKTWAKFLQENLGDGEFSVRSYYDDEQEDKVDILSCKDQEGIVVASIGVMEFNQSRNQDKMIRTEVLMDARGELSQNLIGNLLSSVTFCVIKDGWKIYPGMLIENIVSMYFPELHFKHVMFTIPYQWGDQFSRVILDEIEIYPLLALPITDEEKELVQNRGSEALEDLWESLETDPLDWSRQSAV